MQLNNIEKKNKENNRQYTYRLLKHNIMNINLKPGETINETELSSILNVSRTPIREAIAKLKTRNLVAVQSQKSTIVSKIDENLIEQALFMRGAIESRVIELACTKLSNEAITELEKNIYMQEFNIKFNEPLISFFELDNKFHEIIYKNVNKLEIWKSICNISTHFNRIRFIDLLKTTNRNKVLEQHKQILQSIKDKNIIFSQKYAERHIINFKEYIPTLKEKNPEYFL